MRRSNKLAREWWLVRAFWAYESVVGQFSSCAFSLRDAFAQSTRRRYFDPATIHWESGCSSPILMASSQADEYDRDRQDHQHDEQETRDA